jgi:hypothetical protein
VLENGDDTATSVVETPGKFTVWQKYFAKGNSGITKVNFVACRILVFSGVLVIRD